jgi:integrase
MRRCGSIRKRCNHPKGSWGRCRHPWVVVVDLGEDDNGKRRQVWQTVPEGVDPEQELTRLLRERDQGHLVAESRNLTVGEYLSGQWFPHMKTRVRPSTLKGYVRNSRDYIEPVIADLRLSSLRPAHVQRVIDRMIERKLAARTVLQGYRVLSSALAQAVRWQLIPANPATAIQPPRLERAELSIPTPEQVNKIIAAAEGTWMALPVTLAATTGMRRGEVFGLRWADVDLDESKLHVNGALTWADGELQILSPKTARSRRTVALPPFTVELLRAHRKDQLARRLAAGEAWTDLDLVVDRGDGRPQDPDRLTTRFKDLAASAGVPGARLHDLRHAYATALLRADVHPKIASEALGHASVGFTLDTYAHVVPSMQRASAEAIERALNLQQR